MFLLSLQMKNEVFRRDAFPKLHYSCDFGLGKVFPPHSNPLSKRRHHAESHGSLLESDSWTSQDQCPLFFELCSSCVLCPSFWFLSNSFSLWSFLHGHSIWTLHTKESALWCYLLTLLFYWNTVDTQYYIGFKCTIQWPDNYIHY